MGTWNLVSPNTEGQRLETGDLAHLSSSLAGPTPAPALAAKSGDPALPGVERSEGGVAGTRDDRWEGAGLTAIAPTPVRSVAPWKCPVRLRDPGKVLAPPEVAASSFVKGIYGHEFAQGEMKPGEGKGFTPGHAAGQGAFLGLRLSPSPHPRTRASAPGFLSSPFLRLCLRCLFVSATSAYPFSGPSHLSLSLSISVFRSVCVCVVCVHVCTCVHACICMCVCLSVSQALRGSSVSFPPLTPTTNPHTLFVPSPRTC